MLNLPAVYILADKRNGTLYTGVTSDLPKRVWQNKSGLGNDFSRDHQTHKLVYFVLTKKMRAAIAWGRELKAVSRARKMALIEDMNPNWQDLSAYVIK